MGWKHEGIVDLGLKCAEQAKGQEGSKKGNDGDRIRCLNVLAGWWNMRQIVARRRISLSSLHVLPLSLQDILAIRVQFFDTNPLIFLRLTI